MFKIILNFLVLCNVIVILTLGENEEYSRTILGSSVLLFLFMISSFMFLRKIVFDRLLFLPIFFWLYAGLTLWWSPDFETAKLAFIPLTSTIFTATVLGIAFLNGAERRVILSGVIIALVLHTVGILFGFEFTTAERAVGIGQNANSTGIVLATIVLSTSLLSNDRRLLFFVGLLGFGAGIWTGSRKLLLWIVGFIAILMVRFFKKYSVRNFQGFITFFAICALLLFVSSFFIEFESENLLILDRVVRLFEGRFDESYLVRQSMLFEAIDFWFLNPIFGNGIGSYAAMSSYGVYSHINYFELLSGMGLIGFFLYYLYYLVIILRMHLTKMKQQVEIRFVVIVCVGILVINDVGMVSYSDRPLWLLKMLLMRTLFFQRV